MSDQSIIFTGRIATIGARGAGLSAAQVAFTLTNASGETREFALDPMSNAQRLHLQSTLLLTAATHGFDVRVAARPSDSTPLASEVSIVTAAAQPPRTARAKASKKTATKKKPAKNAAAKRRR